MGQSDKIRENRLRKQAARRGLMLRRSKRRDPGALDYGMYWLVDISTNVVIFGGPGVTGGPNASLDDVEDYLKPE